MVHFQEDHLILKANHMLEYCCLQSEYLSPVLPYMDILCKYTIIGRVGPELLKSVELLIQKYTL